MSSRLQDFSRPRLEFKYVVTLDRVQGFLGALSDLLEQDANAIDGQYRVASLYFDSNDLKAYWEKIEGEDPRYKIRLRYYRELQAQSESALAPPESIFVEAKHRHDQLVSKSRVRINASAFANPSVGVLQPGLSGLVEPSDLAAAEQLDQLLLHRSQEPWVTVSYTRQPYFLRHDRNIRITVDTDIRALSPAQFYQAEARKGLSILPAHMAIVEIKYYWAMPHWLTEMAQNHGLQVRRYSKYASALEAVYPHNTVRQMRLAQWDQRL